MPPVTDQFAEVVALIQQARSRAMQRVNADLIDLYWNVGTYISRKVASSEWGTGVVKELAIFIGQQQPSVSGFSDKNLWRMKRFYEAYTNAPEKLSTVLRQIPWSAHLHILSQTKTLEEKQFYVLKTAQERYSVRELERQLDSGLYERTMVATAQLPETVRQLPQDAAQVFRDSYVFEFLDLPERHNEKDLKQALVSNLSKFLLETGRHFTLAGENVRVQVGQQDFYIDLLLYHRALQCLVAVELKVTKFEPAHIGQLNFYLEALDRDHRMPHENPSIGLLLCASKGQPGSRVRPQPQPVAHASSRLQPPTH